ncbi:hypothetical protein [Phenylobacterium sp.]|uniref:hypothetical protein n=1 Tax=Phenylobacterium sp. TaxID=1871053 RepID=UPI00394BB0CC
MSTRPKVFRARPARTKADRDREADARRGSSHARGYGPRWRRASARRLRDHPLCEYCAAGAWGDPPRVRGASLTDHLYPHGGDQVLFWIEALWVSCCADCHNGPKQAAERRGRSTLDALARHLRRPLLCEVMP